ncbi:hypothetical protein [Gracilimonas sp.]|uniref:hypothetical protein n=1 Tax=Gracilimonas sp. TaxID=1974203 RepID=UPI0028713F77|nr:hypothetical protein [Gracilimonas sp.]
MKPIVKRDKAISETIDNVRSGNLWPAEAMVCLEEIAQEYAMQKCIEQRKICYEEYLDVSQNDTDFGEFILNAPLSTDQ